MREAVMQKDNLEEHNYRTTSDCDGCRKSREGTMLHAHDAMGWATPVLFLCDRCYKPNWWQKQVDGTMRFGKRTYLKAKRLATTTRAEREAHRIKCAKMRERIEASRKRRDEAEARAESNVA